MLGRIKYEPYWQWVAYGKHPAVKDYFNVGHTFQSSRSVADWIEKGYQLLNPGKGSVANSHAWRFWARETRKENIICGILKDSNDSFGRPYPLFIMGTGPLKDWEKNWDLIPYACENTWGQMEFLCARTFNELKRFEEDILKIRPPFGDWPGLDSKRNDLKGTEPQVFYELEKQISNFLQQEDVFICLDQKQFYDTFELFSFYHFLIKTRNNVAPNAIFIGGNAENTYLAIFKRPLVPSDFMRLWSAGSEQR